MEKSGVQPREERLRHVSACLEGLDEVVVDQLREQAILKQTAVEVFNHVYFASNFWSNILQFYHTRIIEISSIFFHCNVLLLCTQSERIIAQLRENVLSLQRGIDSRIGTIQRYQGELVALVQSQKVYMGGCGL